MESPITPIHPCRARRASSAERDALVYATADTREKSRGERPQAGQSGGGQDGVPNVLTAVWTLPDYCALELSLKYLPGEETATVRAEFEGGPRAGAVAAIQCRRFSGPPRR